jgi:hypothetical protein
MAASGTPRRSSIEATGEWSVLDAGPSQQLRGRSGGWRPKSSQEGTRGPSGRAPFMGI